jgi:hypothetical protein
MSITQKLNNAFGLTKQISEITTFDHALFGNSFNQASIYFSAFAMKKCVYDFNSSSVSKEEIECFTGQMKGLYTMASSSEFQ